MDATRGLDRAWSLVLAFHQRFNFPYTDIPTQLARPRAKIRCLWMMEELVEFLEAEDLVDQVDAMMDLMYLALGTLVEMGVKPAGPFNVVHATNLAKVPQAVKGSDLGKAVKGPDWRDPRPSLLAELEHQADLAGEGDLES